MLDQQYSNLASVIIQAIGGAIENLGDDERYAIKIIGGPFHDKAIVATQEQLELISIPPSLKYHIDYEYEFVWCDGCGCYNLAVDTCEFDSVDYQMDLPIDDDDCQPTPLRIEIDLGENETYRHPGFPL